MITKTKAAMSPRILELREKIKDERYVQGAIQRIALVLSNKLIEVKDNVNERQF